jgi:hypothetical protein
MAGLREYWRPAVALPGGSGGKYQVYHIQISRFLQISKQFLLDSGTGWH